MRCTNRVLTLAVAILMALSVSVAMAQPGGGGRGRGPGGPGGGPGGPGGGPGGPGMMMRGGGMMGGGMGILMNPQVREELGITEAQQEAMRKVMDGVRDKFQGLRDLPDEERRAKFQEIMDGVQNEVNGQLTDSQQKRVKEIQLQQSMERGGLGMALQNEWVINELKIDDAQKEKLEAIRKDVEEEMTAMRDKMRPMFEKMRDASPEEREGLREEMQKSFEEMRTKGEAIRASVDEKVKGVLTKDQLSKIDTLKGETFEMLPQQRGDRGQGGEGRQRSRGQGEGGSFRPAPGEGGRRPEGGRAFPPAA